MTKRVAWVDGKRAKMRRSKRREGWIRRYGIELAVPARRRSYSMRCNFPFAISRRAKVNNT